MNGDLGHNWACKDRLVWTWTSWTREARTPSFEPAGWVGSWKGPSEAPSPAQGRGDPRLPANWACCKILPWKSRLRPSVHKFGRHLLKWQLLENTCLIEESSLSTSIVSSVVSVVCSWVRDPCSVLTRISAFFEGGEVCQGITSKASVPSPLQNFQFRRFPRPLGSG